MTTETTTSPIFEVLPLLQEWYPEVEKVESAWRNIKKPRRSYDPILETKSSTGSTSTNQLLNLGKLPLDILLEIMDLLPVEDLVSMRSVNKVISRATKTPGIWHKLIRYSNTIIPHNPRPISSYTASEAEHDIRRSKQMTQWENRDLVHMRCQYETIRSNHLVYKAEFVPGGRYLIMACKVPNTAQHCIRVFDLDRGPPPGSDSKAGNAGCVAEWGTSNEIDQLRVCYMDMEEKPGLAIAWVEPQYPVKSRNEYPKRPHLRHPELQCRVRVRYFHLHQLDNTPIEGRGKGYNTPPKRILAETLTYATTNVKLDMDDGVIAIAYRSHIHFMSLRAKLSSRLYPAVAPVMHNNTVHGIKLLPNQNQILLIRNYKGEIPVHHTLELHDLPAWGEKVFMGRPTHQHVLDIPIIQFDISRDCVLRQPQKDYKNGGCEHDDELHRLYNPVTILGYGSCREDEAFMMEYTLLPSPPPEKILKFNDLEVPASKRNRYPCPSSAKPNDIGSGLPLPPVIKDKTTTWDLAQKIGKEYAWNPNGIRYTLPAYTRAHSLGALPLVPYGELAAGAERSIWWMRGTRRNPTSNEGNQTLWLDPNEDHFRIYRSSIPDFVELDGRTVACENEWNPLTPEDNGIEIFSDGQGGWIDDSLKTELPHTITMRLLRDKMQVNAWDSSSGKLLLVRERTLRCLDLVSFSGWKGC